MALSVLNNIASLAAQNQLTITNGNLQKALFQLSSGSRINTGADDAAGLAIADGLHANITALTQSARNANDGVGELQVADGSLAAVTTLLNRSITIATEAATGTVSDAQRIALNDEFTAIKSEIDRVGSKTNYNGGQVFTANTLNVFLSDSGATSNSTIGVTTGLLSSTGLSLGGAVAASGTLTQAAGAAAVAATDTLTGGAFTASAVATGTLTATGAPVATNTATVNGQVYTFVAALTGAANEVLVGGTEALSLSNLAAAINATSGGAGVAYGAGTVANTAVTATSTATTVVVTAKVNGTAGNGITTTAAGGTFTFGAASTAGGTAGSTVTVGGKTYTFVAALSNTATANEVISSSEATGLANLASAVNAGTGSGTTYSTPTTQNTSVSAGTATATTLLFTALSPGTGGNFLTGAATVGSFGTANFAGGLNTGAAPVAAAGNTVTVGTQTYTFVTALSTTPTANEVLVGATETASLANLANAVNGGTGSGATYGSPTVANTSASAVATASTVVFTALTKGLTGNGIATSATGTANTFGAATLANGTAGSTNDLLSIADATAALTTINAAIQTVAGLRGSIGATVNRLQSAAGVITNQVQNLTGAEDGVRAADIPSTVATLAKYSILEQTGISALAQANQQQQLVLKLLQ
ncbi:MAG TPA: flagellin [Candidatus Acidoferrum sp.]|nr:flagellin [Candidatus Acidoferrum sp.]